MGLRTIRRAARFARAVEASRRPDHAPSGHPDTGGASEPLDAETRGLVTLATRLHETDFDGSPDPQFKAQLRHRLVTLASVQLPRQAEHARARALPPGAPRSTRPAGHSPQPTRPPRGGPRLAFVAAMMCMLVMLSGLAIIASHRALPGDALYSLKRTTEDISVSVARGDEARAWRLLDFAHTRAGEALDVLGTDGTPSGEDVTRALRTLRDMDSNTLEGTRLLTVRSVAKRLDRPLADLSAWSSDQRALLDPITNRLSGAAAVRADQSLGLLTRIIERVTALRSQLGCSCLASTTIDDLGPIPCWPCDPATTAPPQIGTPPDPTGGGGGSNGPGSGTPGAAGTTPPTGGSPSGTGGSPTGADPSDSALPTLPQLPTVPPEPSDGGLLPPLLPSGLLPPLPPLLPGLLPG